MIRFKFLFWSIFICLGLTLQAKNSLPFSSGKVSVVLSNGEILNVGLDPTFHLPIYFTEGEFLPGTRFRLNVTNSSYPFIYVIGSDQSNNAAVIYKGEIKPGSLSEDNPLIVPQGRSFLSIDSSPGKDYISVLFSPSPIDIDYVLSELIRVPGNYYDKLEKVLLNAIIPESEIGLTFNKAGFRTLNDSMVIPLTLEFRHQQ